MVYRCEFKAGVQHTKRPVFTGDTGGYDIFLTLLGCMGEGCNVTALA
jgi:hypothetical protein